LAAADACGLEVAEFGGSERVVEVSDFVVLRFSRVHAHLQARPSTTDTGDSIEAHLTSVSADFAVSRWIEARDRRVNTQIRQDNPPLPDHPDPDRPPPSPPQGRRWKRSQVCAFLTRCR
jgi:hypothetical protein